MKFDIGVLVLRDAIAVARIRSGDLLWDRVVARDPESSWAVCLASVLQSVPKRGIRRPRVSIAFGPSFGSFRKVHGLPGNLTGAEVERALRLAPSKYFALGGPLSVTSAMRIDGEWWAGCIPTRELELATDTVPAVTLDLRRLTLFAAVAACDINLPYCELVDGDTAVAVATTAAAGRVAMDRLTVDGSSDERPLPAIDGARVAAASVNAPAFPIPGRRSSATRLLRAMRIGATAASIVGLGTAFVLPPLLTYRVAEDAAATIELRPMVSRESQSRAYEEAAGLALYGFATTHPSVTKRLEEISSTLPTGAVLLTYHHDSAALTIVALTPDAAGLIRGIELLDDVRAVSTLGPITRERHGSNELHRIALKAEYARGVSR